MLSDDDFARQTAGGTWTDIFDEGGLNGWLPWLVWLVAVEMVFLAALPLSARLLRRLPDRGIVLARPLGLLLVAWLVWLGASVGVWTFSRGSVVWAIAIVAAVSGVLLCRNPRLLGAARRNWRYLASMEALFIAAYLAFVLIRAANPDLWHPWRGGEKPMDLTYLTAVVKSTTFPPYDPWFAGGYINYYYFGFVVVGLLMRLTGIVPEVAYNLAVPLLFALTLTGAYSVGYNLAAALRRRGALPMPPPWTAPPERTPGAGSPAAATPSSPEPLLGCSWPCSPTSTAPSSCCRPPIERSTAPSSARSTSGAAAGSCPARSALPNFPSGRSCSPTFTPISSRCLSRSSP